MTLLMEGLPFLAVLPTLHENRRFLQVMIG